MAKEPPSPSLHVEPGGAADACDQESAPPGWARWVQRISLAIAVVAMAIAIWSVGPSTLLGHLLHIGWWFAVLIAIEGVITLLDAGAVHSLACDRGAGGYRGVLFAQIAGRAVNMVTPAG